MPTISVIVPVYNTEKYLRRCVDSILAQTFTDFELILVDDGSTDTSGAICDEYAAKDSRVRVIHQENQGQAAARNVAINNAYGEFLCFIDADDLVHKQYLDILFQGLCGNKNTICMCDALESSELPVWFHNRRIECTEYNKYDVNEDTLLTFYESDYMCGTVWGKIIPIEVARQSPFTEGRIYEDNAVVVKWIDSVNEIASTSEKLYFYQINLDGTTKKRMDEKKFRDSVWAIEQQILFFEKKKMRRLKSRTASSFLVVLTYRYFTALDYDRNLAHKIRACAKRKWRMYRKDIVLPAEKRLYVLEMLYPLMGKIYWKLKMKR